MQQQDQKLHTVDSHDLPLTTTLHYELTASALVSTTAQSRDRRATLTAQQGGRTAGGAAQQGEPQSKDSRATGTATQLAPDGQGVDVRARDTVSEGH